MGERPRIKGSSGGSLVMGLLGAISEAAGW